MGLGGAGSHQDHWEAEMCLLLIALLRSGHALLEVLAAYQVAGHSCIIAAGSLLEMQHLRPSPDLCFSKIPGDSCTPVVSASPNPRP